MKFTPCFLTHTVQLLHFAPKRNPIHWPGQVFKTQEGYLGNCQCITHYFYLNLEYLSWIRVYNFFGCKLYSVSVFWDSTVRQQVGILKQCQKLISALLDGTIKLYLKGQQRINIKVTLYQHYEKIFQHTTMNYQMHGLNCSVIVCKEKNTHQNAGT